jgi:HlyD family secretion protein
MSKKQKIDQPKPARSSRRPKWVRWAALVVVVALLSAGTYVFVRARQTTAAASSASTLQTATARTGNLVLQASGSGYLVAASEANIAFEIDGKLAELDVKLGDQVEKGQILARLDDASLQYKLEEAQLALLELTSPEAIANAELAVTTAQADVITAQAGVNNQQYWKNDALIQDYYASYVIAMRPRPLWTWPRPN